MTSNKNYLVTGVDGFIGGNLQRELLTMGSQVLGLDKDYLEFDGWEEHLLSEVDGFNPDAIFHVGACSDTLSQNSQLMMLQNFESSKVLSDWATINNVPFLYSSSAANYGVNGRYPSNLYGWSKYVAEKYVISNGGIALRYFNVYGPGEEHKGRMASFAFQAFTSHMVGAEVKLFPGKPTRDFVHVSDVIAANIFALENWGKLRGSYYEVGTGTSESFELVLNLLDIPFTYHSESMIPNGYQYFTQSDVEKWMPGWKAIITLRSGMEMYRQYLDENRHEVSQ